VTSAQIPLTVYGDHDEGTLDQLRTCADPDLGATAGVLCADGHLGYSQPIGGVVAYHGKVSPSGVGYDIACGNKAVLTNLTLEAVAPYLDALADEINERISFGVGRKNNEPADHQVLDHIREAGVEQQRDLYDKAAAQLGTVGAGNHYVDLFADEQDRIWIGVHFGSRGFGHTTASGFMALGKGLEFGARIRDDMDAPPILFDADSGLGEAYVEAMSLAGEYAYAGRDLVCDKVLEILGAEAVDEVHNHHNFAWLERHDGRDVWVVRKGATPAFPGQRGFVGGSMGDESVILEGLETLESTRALHSTVHGAGRAMSRTKAAGKMGKVYECTERDCEFRVRRREYADERQKRGLKEHDRFTMCPDHPDGKMKSRRARIREGLVDFDAVQTELADQGIVLRGGAADEAPAAYKRLPDVLAHHGGTIRILERLRPLVVVMAEGDTFDPYKD
jgi:tRNA-splicing ligase RtcB